MTRQVRRVALVMVVLFAALFVNLNYLQVLRANALAGDQRNIRTIIEEYRIDRGSIVVGRGSRVEEIAQSVETDGRLRYRREYTDGPLYAHVTGYHSLVYGRAGLEDSANRYLTGDSPEVFARNFADLLTGRERVGDDVHLTIRPRVQRAAREALGNRTGAVVAVEPDTGALLAVWANPTYDPNRLSSFEREEVVEYWESNESERRNRALRELYPPGSTFKIVTAAAALENGYSIDDTFPDPQTYTPPLTSRGIPNFGGGLCNNGSAITLRRSLEVSCNTVFARLGNEIGTGDFVAQAEAFGLNTAVDGDVPIATSQIPTDLDEPATAQSAIGQRDVRVTPLQMALISGAVANGGEMMRPRLIDRVTDVTGEVIRQFGPRATGRAVSEEAARDLTAMMVGVVDDGSGRNAAISGVSVAGKTGTAQTGEGQNPTVWFTGFAPADNAKVAVAVVVPDGGDVGSEATGGQVAAPIARAVLRAALGEDG